MKHLALLIFISLLCLSILPVSAGAQTPAPAPAEPADENTYAEVPDEFIQEAQRFADHCKGDADMRQYKDCECLAVKYLDQRIKLGKDADSTAILGAIEEQCPDATEAAGIHFEKCKADLLTIPPGVPVDAYCACYANNFAKLFEASNAEAYSGTFVRLRVQAHMICSDPDMVYPRTPKK